MAKRISHREVRRLGDERIAILTELSLEAVKEGRNDRARRYTQIARAISGKAQTEIPEGFRYCRKCNLPSVPGITCRVRLTGGKISSSCICGNVWRMPYLKEQRK